MTILADLQLLRLSDFTPSPKYPNQINFVGYIQHQGKDIEYGHQRVFSVMSDVLYQKILNSWGELKYDDVVTVHGVLSAWCATSHGEPQSKYLLKVYDMIVKKGANKPKATKDENFEDDNVPF